MKWLLSLIVAASAFGLIFAQDEVPEPRDSALKQGDVFVPPKLRIRNQNGNCVWCASQDCFWGAGGWDEYDAMKERAVREGWGGAGMHNVLKACHDAGIDVVSTESLYVTDKATGQRVPSPFVHVMDDPWQVIVDGIANGTGCYVEIPGHAIMVCGADDDGVRILDNNGDLKVQPWSARRFKSAWEQHACFPLFNRRRHPKPAPVQPVAPAPTPPTTPVIGPPGKDGKDGKDGAPGKDADSAALLAKIAVLQKQIESLKQPKPADSSAIRVIVSPKKGH